MSDLSAIRNSALWAAWADAMGFITELADEDRLKRRTGTSHVERTVEWKRRVGGRGGPTVTLPAGCYSDDTQLRLATSRAIRGDGTFDVEAFSKIELPVWPAYSLGAGRGSKTAATSLAGANSKWMTNFFDTKRSRYVDGGGNGAAMRIQPHVWSSSDPSRIDSWLPAVVQNALCTHGHPRGFLGAVFHAYILAETMRHRRVPDPDAWKRGVDVLPAVHDVLEADEQLGQMWVPTWKRQTERDVHDAIHQVIDECQTHVSAILPHLNGSSDESGYDSVIEALGLREPSQRGSGTRTAIAAAFLAWRFDRDPQAGIITAVNALGTDTDTIGTMAAAVLGYSVKSEPPDRPQDVQAISTEAARMWSIAVGRSAQTFAYPDLLSWDAPKTQVDTVVTVDDSLALLGLGVLEPRGEPLGRNGRLPAIWQWMRLPFGQHVLIKRREHPPDARGETLPEGFIDTTTPPKTRRSPSHDHQERLFIEDEGQAPDRQPSRRLESKRHRGDSAWGEEVESLARAVVESGFDRGNIGDALIRISEGIHGIDRAAAFAGLVARAWRRKRDSQ